MAVAGKAAVVATLMFALLLSASVVDAARPVVEPGSTVAADGSALVREGRQLKTLCLFFWWKCSYYRPKVYYTPTPYYGIKNDKHRRLNFLFFGHYDYKPRFSKFRSYYFWH